MKNLELNNNPEFGGKYGFDTNEIFVVNPIVSDCGRFAESPEKYGFTVLDTGWDCIGHSQEFLLNGKKVFMLINDENHLVNDKTIYANVAVIDPDLMNESLEDSIIDQWTISR